MPRAVKKSTETVEVKSPSGGLTVGDLFQKISRIKLNQALYIALLIALFAIGYLLARVQMLENGSAQTTTQPTAQTANPQVPAGKVEVATGDLPVKGDENAPVTIIEFSDFECPFCEQFYTQTMAQLVSEYVDTGKAKIYYRHFPLDFHPAAKPAALASECANDQGKFWEYHDIVFENQGKIAGGGETSNAALKQFAADLGLNTAQFDNCFDTAQHEAEVTADLTDGQAAGTSGTPTFYINGRQLVGAQPFSAFQAVIDEELGS